MQRRSCGKVDSFQWIYTARTAGPQNEHAVPDYDWFPYISEESRQLRWRGLETWELGARVGTQIGAPIQPSALLESEQREAFGLANKARPSCRAHERSLHVARYRDLDFRLTTSLEIENLTPGSRPRSNEREKNALNYLIRCKQKF